MIIIIGRSYKEKIIEKTISIYDIYQPEVVQFLLLVQMILYNKKRQINENISLFK
jgi:hypothetical protein